MARSAEYDAYLASAAWQVKRLAVLERDSYRCRVCDSSQRLDVHHRTYKNFGDEPLDDLTTLCRDCHERHHSAKRKTKAKAVVKVQKLCECGCGQVVRKRFAPGHAQRQQKRAKRSRKAKVAEENERLHRLQRANKMKQQAVRDGIVSPSLRAELVARARH